MNTCKTGVKEKLSFLQRIIVASHTSVEPYTSRTTSSSMSFHAALCAWLILYGSCGEEPGDVEPTKLVFNIFDIPENQSVREGNSCSSNSIYQLTFPPFSPPLSYPFTPSGDGNVL